MCWLLVQVVYVCGRVTWVFKMRKVTWHTCAMDAIISYYNSHKSGLRKNKLIWYNTLIWVTDNTIIYL
jgi:hypothetical protein